VGDQRVRHALNVIARVLLCAAGFVIAIYGTLQLDGLKSLSFREVLREPVFWLTVFGSVLTGIAFAVVQRPRDASGRAPQPPATVEARTEPRKDESSESPVEDGDKLSLVEVVGLAAGGVIGSGWLLAVPGLHERLGEAALLGWAAGGVLMLTIAVVMVEFGLISQRTGGLLFHPHDAFGPLVVIILAASLWISYAINPAAQAAAAVDGLAEVVPALAGPGGLTGTGSVLAVLVTAAIIGFVLLPRRLVLRTNAVLTLVKIALPVVLVVCLALAAPALAGSGPGAGAPPPGPTSTGVLSALITSGVIYAYIGFQAPLDVTGEVRGGTRAVARRVRWAVYGTVVGSFLLYSALQLVYAQHMAGSGAEHGTSYARLTDSATLIGAPMDWLVVLVRLAAIIAPIGSGIVFTYALSREVYALSAERYVPSGLHEPRASRLPGRTSDSFWLILLVNLVLALVVLVAVGGDWHTLAVLNTIPILILYAVTCVVLAVRSELLGAGLQQFLPVAAYAAFVAIALVVNESAWDRVWKGVAVIAWGSLVLLVLPWLHHLRFPGLGWYDAKNHGARLFSRDPANRPFVLLAVYLAALTLLSAVRHRLGDDSVWSVWSLRGLVMIVASGAFVLLVGAGRRYLRLTTTRT
jgi:amino acid transporter